MLRKLLLLLFLPLFLLSQETSSLTETNIENEKKQLELQNKQLDEVISKINDKTFISKTFIDENEYKKQIQLLKNKIVANKKAHNNLAVKRDEVKLLSLVENKKYYETLTNIIKGKEEYKDKEYFENIIRKNINYLEENSLDKYKSTYETEKNSEKTISKAFIQNYIELFEQNSNQLFILNNLLSNMERYRKTNFFLDEFNLQYLVNKIDSLKGISFVSNLTSYYLKFSIGEIAVVLIIMAFFRLLNRRIISILANLISRVFVKSSHEDSETIRQYLRTSIDTPLIYALYTFAIQISLFILVKDPELLADIMPWINTLYMALFTWAIYAILSNSINIYAHSLVEKHPNVRKEMITFVMRIIKIILILLVILFLFSQLGIDIKAIAASLGVGGIAIALASKDTLANFFGSLNIMTDNSFSQGDWIKTSEVEGTVVDIRMRSTRIRTFDNAMITVPNSQLANTHIMNWSKRKIGRRIKMHVGITYESKMEDIVNLKNDIYNMLDNHPHIASVRNAQNTKTKRFEAVKKEDLQGIKRTLLVYIDQFGPSSIDILIYCFSRSPNWEDWLTVKEDVLVKVSQLAERNNCEFAYPTQMIHVKNDSEIATMQQEEIRS